MKGRLIIATGNKGKVREIKRIFEGMYDEILSLKDAGISVDIVEDADSFIGNAEKKALTISRLVDSDVLADDSGLCVDGLGGRPGVYSARYSAEGTDTANNKKLVEEVSALPESERGAKYVCAMVLAKGGQVICESTGECHGVIITHAEGDGGFGYDPYFFLPDYGITFGQMDPDEKNKISHRAKALFGIRKYLEERG